MRFCSLVVLASGLLWLSSQPVAAGIVQYNYVGMPFAVTSGSPPSSVTNISGDFQFNQALVPLPTSAPDDITSLITAFSFTDGNQTLTKLNTSSFSFQVTLDSSGALVSPWEINIGDLSSGPGTPDIFAYTQSMWRQHYRSEWLYGHDPMLYGCR